MAYINEKIFKAKYALDDNETFEMMCRRVADNEEQFLAIKNKEIMPAGRHLAAKGSPFNKTLFNCYALSHQNIPDKGIDSRESISMHESRSDNLASRGGGIGTNWTSLRPINTLISSNGGGSSGTVSFIRRYSFGQSIVTQGGSRRGANMACLMINHPEIEKFIDAKQDLNELNNVNISVMINNEFMNAVKNDQYIDLYFPDFEKNKQEYNNNWDGNLFETNLDIKVYKTIKAKDLWNHICTNAWKTGEPGILFYDNINNVSNYRDIEKVKNVNPCGEQTLPEDSSCNLLSINLLEHVLFGNRNSGVNVNKLDMSIKKAIDYLDKAIDIENYTDKLIEKNQKYYRQIGLGIMGFADMLIMLGIKYGSEDSFMFTEGLAQFILDRAYYWSAMRSKEYGKAPIWQEHGMNDHYINLCSKETQEIVRKYGLRNSAVLSIAPTGSISMMCGVNGGIEPYFAFRYERDDVLGKRIIEEDIVNNAPNTECLVTAQEVTPEQHVKMQAIWQKYVDSSISKTINLPSTATVEDVQNAYMLAWELGCKGTTVYRDGCRMGVLNHIKDDVSDDVTDIRNIFKEYGNRVIPIGVKPPKSSYMKKKKVKTNNGKKFYFMTGYLEKTFETPFELFITTNCHEKNDVVESIIDKMRYLLIDKGVDEDIVVSLRDKAKKSSQNNIDRIARLISMALRHNLKIDDIVCVLDEYTESISSLIYHIKKHLESLIPDNTIVESEKCPECGSDIIYVSGCKQCSDSACGWSKC